MEYKITKVRKYGKGMYTSEKIGIQWYDVVYAHLYDRDKGLRYKVHFMHLMDMEDVWEYYNNFNCEEPDENKTKDSFTDKEIKECKDEMIWCTAESLFYGNDIEQIIKNCNDTIYRYR